MGKEGKTTHHAVSQEMCLKGGQSGPMLGKALVGVHTRKFRKRPWTGKQQISGIWRGHRQEPPRRGAVEAEKGSLQHSQVFSMQRDVTSGWKKSSSEVLCFLSISSYFSHIVHSHHPKISQQNTCSESPFYFLSSSIHDLFGRSVCPPPSSNLQPWTRCCP